jgi:hypothetical protein
VVLNRLKEQVQGLEYFINQKEKGSTHILGKNERIMSIRFKIDRGYMTLTGIQAPEEGKIESTNTFYEQLQEIIGKINKNDYYWWGGGEFNKET